MNMPDFFLPKKIPSKWFEKKNFVLNLSITCKIYKLNFKHNFWRTINNG